MQKKAWHLQVNSMVGDAMEICVKLIPNWVVCSYNVLNFAKIVYVVI